MAKNKARRRQRIVTSRHVIAETALPPGPREIVCVIICADCPWPAPLLRVVPWGRAGRGRRMRLAFRRLMHTAGLAAMAAAVVAAAVPPATAAASAAVPG